MKHETRPIRMIFGKDCAKTNPVGMAIAMASYCHAYDKDKGGNAYILHPIRIMMRLRSDDEVLNIMAIMHDVLEDHWEILCNDDLEYFGFDEEVIKGIDILTHFEHDTYEQYIDRILESKRAMLVKMKDLEDNSNITRMIDIEEKDFKRLEKYHRAFHKIKKALAVFEN